MSIHCRRGEVLVQATDYYESEEAIPLPLRRIEVETEHLRGRYNDWRTPACSMA